MPGDPGDATPIERHLAASHGEWLDAIESAADAVAAGWTGEGTTDRAAVVDPLEAGLRERGAIEAAPPLLLDLADRAGMDLPAPPVAGAPYVVVTGEGLVCRATGPTRRLVLTVRVFAVEVGPPTTYRRADGPIEDAVAVEFRE